MGISILLYFLLCWHELENSGSAPFSVAKYYSWGERNGPKEGIENPSPALRAAPKISVSQLGHGENFTHSTLVLGVYKTYYKVSREINP